MAKGKKKYQFAGSTNTTFSDWYSQNYGNIYGDLLRTSSPVQQRYLQQGRVLPSDPFGGGRATSPQNDPGAQGYNYYPDGVWRKQQITENQNSPLSYSPAFQALNPTLDLVQGIAGSVNNQRQLEEERQKLLRSREQMARYNVNEQGLNNVPVYFQYGGDILKRRSSLPEGTIMDYREVDGKWVAFPSDIGYTYDQAVNDGLVYELPNRTTAKRFASGEFVQNGIDYRNYLGRQTAASQKRSSLPTSSAVMNLQGSQQSGYQVYPEYGVVPDSYQTAQQQGQIYSFDRLRDARRFQSGERFIPQQNIAINTQPVVPQMRSIDTSTQNIETRRPSVNVAAVTPQPIASNQNENERFFGARGRFSNWLRDRGLVRDELQNGGIVNNTGYLPQYSTSNNPINIIPSNNITMNGVPHGVLGIPNNGAATYLPPNSGRYKFDGAQYVTEVPVYQNGGVTEQDQFMQILAVYAQQNNLTPEQLMEELEKVPENQREQVIAQIIESVQGSQQQMMHGGKKKKSRYLQNGGGVLEVSGTPDSPVSVELEKGEIFQTEDGAIQKVAETEDRHEDGGSNQPFVSRVLEDTSDKRKDKNSKLLKINPSDAEGLVGFKPKNSVSHSKLYELAVEHFGKRISKMEKDIENNLEYSKSTNSKYARNSLEENVRLLEQFPTNGELFDLIYNHQEVVKERYKIPNAPVEAKHGGKFQFGTSDIEPTGAVNLNLTPGEIRQNEITWGGQVGVYNPSGRPEVSPAVNKTITGSGITPSTFNEPLHWYDMAGGVLNYLSSSERDPVSLEQITPTQLQARELNPLPALLQQGDYSAAVAQLPNSGVGFANQANLAANRYRATNELLGNAQNTNIQLRNQIDQYNAQQQDRVATQNLQLRDQFVVRQAQAKEAQQQSKLNALDDMFTKITQNRKLNREGNLTMQLTPYFDQFGNFNGNKLDLENMRNDISAQGYTTETVKDALGRTVEVVKDRTGKRIKQMIIPESALK